MNLISSLMMTNIQGQILQRENLSQFEIKKRTKLQLYIERYIQAYKTTCLLVFYFEGQLSVEGK